MTVRDLTVNRAFDVIRLEKGAMAARIEVTDSRFEAISGRVLAADSETDGLGRYNVEAVSIRGSSFTRVGGGVASVLRGGTDESTFGPRFAFLNNVLDAVGGAATPALALHGVQDVRGAGNRFADSGVVHVVRTTGEPQTEIADNAFVRTPDPIVTSADAAAPARREGRRP